MRKKKTEDRRQKTEDSGEEEEDRRQKTEGRHFDCNPKTTTDLQKVLLKEDSGVRSKLSTLNY